MRKILFALPLAFLLSACDPRVQQVIDGVKTACNFEIVSSAVLPIIGQGSVAEAISAFCAAANQLKLRRAARPGGLVTLRARIQGQPVTVQGRFVR